MNEQFQQAVVASRAGQIKEAQFLLTQSLQEDSSNANAWLLLSQLVDSKEKQQSYLAKAVALDPEHELANEYRTSLEEDVAVATLPVVEDVDEMADLEAILDEDVDDPLSDLDESSMDDWLSAAVAADSGDDEDESLDAVDAIDFAELLDESDEEMEEEAAVETVADEPIAPEEKQEVVAEKKEEETAVVDPKAAKRQKSADQLNYAIYGLMAIAILIVLYMAYLLFG